LGVKAMHEGVSRHKVLGTSLVLPCLTIKRRKDYETTIEED
jgi:hypothetical protein